MGSEIPICNTWSKAQEQARFQKLQKTEIDYLEKQLKKKVAEKLILSKLIKGVCGTGKKERKTE